MAVEYPVIKPTQQARQVVDVFLGYNHNLRNAENEFYEMQNMTSDHYPVLAPRKKRRLRYPAKTDKGVTGLLAKGLLCFVEGEYFYLFDRDGRLHDYDLGLTSGKKQLIAMGSYVIILPDKKYINTVDALKDFGDIEVVNTTTATTDVSFTLCTEEGAEYADDTGSDTAPENPKNGATWIDTSNKPPVLKKYSATEEKWVSVPTTYIKIKATGIGAGLNQYDGVTISGIKEDAIKDLNGSHVLWGCSEDEIIITGMLDGQVTQTADTGAITVSRKMPDMDFVFEHNNRLWGCRYGYDKELQVPVNEAYASKLGDFKNWNCSMGISTDSWRASCGTPGKFTGAIAHKGYPLFFKEDHMHKVYGSIPSAFQMESIACRGVQNGSGDSLAIVNDTLFFKSLNGVCAYDGSVPVEISQQFGNERYTDAVGGACENKYYISMLDTDGNSHLFVYDTMSNLWHREDDFRASSFCTYKNELYAIDEHSKNIVAMRGSVGDPLEVGGIDWSVETGLLGMATPDMKYVSKILLRLSLAGNSSVDIFIQYDSMEDPPNGGWIFVTSINAKTLRSYSVPIQTHRCDHFRLKIEGKGDCKIYSITKTIEQGSDVS